VCSLEQASADDGLLPLLSLGGQAVQSLVVFTTQLLPETHQQMLNLLMVSFNCSQPGRSHWAAPDHAYSISMSQLQDKCMLPESSWLGQTS
jgi:hypothetical protein